MFNMAIMARDESEDFDNDDLITEEQWIEQVSRISGKYIYNPERYGLYEMFESCMTAEQAARLI